MHRAARELEPLVVVADQREREDRREQRQHGPAQREKGEHGAKAPHAPILPRPPAGPREAPRCFHVDAAPFSTR